MKLAGILALVAGTIIVWQYIANQQLQAQLAIAQANVVTLQGAVEQQNRKINEWKAKADADNAVADAAAVRTLQRHHNRSLPQGTGPEAMNLYLRELFHDSP